MCFSPGIIYGTYLVAIGKSGGIFTEWSVKHNRNRIRVRTYQELTCVWVFHTKPLFLPVSGVKERVIKERVQKQVVNARRGMTDTRRPHQLLVSLKYFRCKGIERCGRCPVSIDILYEVYAKGGEKVLHFDPPRRGDPPPSSELIAV